MSPFLRKVKTASGATAVQIVEKKHGVRTILEHLGSAHDEAELAALMQVGQEKLHVNQPLLDLPTRGGVQAGAAVIEAKQSKLLVDVIRAAWRRLGFDVIEDEAFFQLVLARLVEPTSKLDSIRVIEDLGLRAPHRNTFTKALRRCADKEYRDRIAHACFQHVWTDQGGDLSLLMYDVTTLYFETDTEDSLRKVGFSKERRVDPQIVVGLLVDRTGFPLEIACFEGNKAETQTIIPIIKAFQARHGVADMVVVADAGMLSAGNLNALEDAGFSFIVGSRISKAPYDLAAHFERHGDYFADGQILESSRVMGRGKDARTRRVVYQYSFKRYKRDNRSINAMVERAEKVAAGTRPVKKDRFVRINGADKDVDWALVERARQLAGLKGYVSNIDPDVMSGSQVISAYHDLWHVEKSFRMAKSDLRARPMFHHQKDSIEAHLTIVFAALAVSRYLQDVTGLSIKKLINTLRPIRSATIALGDQRLTLEPEIPTEVQDLLATIAKSGH